MKFRILGDSIITSNSAYKGLYREEPIYIEDDELYPFWDWYATEAGDGGYISDIEKAKKLVEMYAKKEYIMKSSGLKSKKLALKIASLV